MPSPLLPVTLLSIVTIIAGCRGPSRVIETGNDTVPNETIRSDTAELPISTDSYEFHDKADAEKDVQTAFLFEEYQWLTKEPDVLTDRLCPGSEDPESVPDKVFIDCDTEGESFTDPGVEHKTEVVVMAYNMERGEQIDGQIELIRDHPDVPLPDVILVNEVDRGCARSGHRHIARDLAKALDMNYVFAVEFVELGRPEICEHGNAILSRYPLGNVRQIRHETQVSWYGAPGSGGQPRLGGRIAVYADVKVGDKFLHVYSLHLESNVDHTFRTAQAAEIAEDGLSMPYTVIAGGDINAGLYMLDVQSGEPIDPTTAEFFNRGYSDSHDGLSYQERITSPAHGFILDILFGLKADFSEPAVCPGEHCDHLSDHRPIWTTVGL